MQLVVLVCYVKRAKLNHFTAQSPERRLLEWVPLGCMAVFIWQPSFLMARQHAEGDAVWRRWRSVICIRLIFIVPDFWSVLSLLWRFFLGGEWRRRLNLYLYTQPRPHKHSRHLLKASCWHFILFSFQFAAYAHVALFILEPIWPCSHAAHVQFMRQHRGSVHLQSKFVVLSWF